MQEITHVYIDSDGVLADFDKKVNQILEGRKIVDLPKGLMWAKIQQYNDTVEPFFESLEIMPGARLLVDFIKSNFINHAVLSATGFTPKDGAQQKVNWYRKHFPGLKVICVSKSPDKAAYATPTSILIDDRAKSIDPWVAAGGIGILHTSVNSTIRELQEYL